MALPANVNFCYVTARFIRAVADGVDGGFEPDGIPLSGLTVRFASSLAPAVVRNTAISPPVTIVIDPITCTTDADGVLLGPAGGSGVMLVASNDADLSPNGWTYSVTVSGPSFPSISFSFTAPVGGTIDLSTVIPVPSSPGTEIAAWQAVVSQVTAARDQAIAAAEEAENSGGAVKSVNGAVGIVALTQDDIADGSVAKKYTATEKTKLSGVATSATANDTDTNLKARGNHTGTQAQSTVVNLTTDLAAKAALASPALTGTPTAPTPSTSDDTTKLATTAFVKAALATLISGAPGLLDTLDEMAAALGDDPNFAATMTTLIGQKAPLSSPTLTGTPTAPTADPEESSSQIANTAYVQTELVALQATIGSIVKNVRIEIPYSAVTGWPSRVSYIPAWLVGARATWDSFPHAGIITPPDMLDIDDWNKKRE